MKMFEGEEEEEEEENAQGALFVSSKIGGHGMGTLPFLFVILLKSIQSFFYILGSTYFKTFFSRKYKVLVFACPLEFRVGEEGGSDMHRRKRK